MRARAVALDVHVRASGSEEEREGESFRKGKVEKRENEVIQAALILQLPTTSPVSSNIHSYNF